MGTLWLDFRYGLRTLRKNPAFTAIAIITLALGIGANTATFSIVNAVVLRPLPYEDPGRVMLLSESNAQRDLTDYGVSPPDYLDWKAQSRSFKELAAYRGGLFRFTSNAGAERLTSMAVTAKFFPLLGGRPLLGRVFTEEEERPGANNVIILSEGFWRRSLGADPAVLGRTLTMNERPYTVVGVMPQSFEFPLFRQPVSVWTPLVFDKAALQDRAAYTLGVLGRLGDGVSVERAREEMATIAGRLQQAYPATNAGWTASVKPLHDAVVGNVRPAMLTLLGTVFLVLLIACFNVASILSARMAARRKEIVLRTALGATRRRILRQLLTESILLGLIGGGCGVLLALSSMQVLLAYLPANIPRIEAAKIDPTVLAFTLVVSVATGVIFGMLPAWQMTRTNLNEVLKSGTRGSTEGGQNRFRNLLVVSEVALSTVLLVTAGLLIRSFVALKNADPGFRMERVLVVTQLVLPPRYVEGNRGVGFFKELFQRVRALPGVESVGGITALPLQSNSALQAYAEAARPRPQGQELTAVINTVGEDYFKTLGVPLRRGRLFTERDDAKAPKVVLINEALSRQVFADRDPLGQHLHLRGGDTPYEVVGVVGDVKQFALGEEARPEIFTHYLESPVTFMYVLVKTLGEPAGLAAPIRREVQAIDPEQPVGHRTLIQQLDNAVVQPRFYAMLLGVFAGLALVLAAVGLYGVVSYMVVQRRSELGIRMALGAQPRDVLKLVMGRGLRLVLLGLAIGVALSFATTSFMSSLLYGVAAVDPLTFGAIPLLLVLVALVACFVPAYRATRLDPLVALRND